MNFSIRQFILKMVYPFLKKFGHSYDFGFIIEDRVTPARSFYCSELVYTVLKNTHDDFPFVLRKVWGAKTVVPDDFYNARRHFDVVWEFNT